MKNLFDAMRVNEVMQRISQLTPDAERQWGKMNVSQMLAHCALGMQAATGEQKRPRMLVGRILGPIIKPLAVKDDAPMKRNSPTAPGLTIQGDPDFEAERAKFKMLVERFGTAGAAGCTDHPHAFFGRMTPEEWAILTYKHVDHHLRQFGV